MQFLVVLFGSLCVVLAADLAHLRRDNDIDMHWRRSGPVLVNKSPCSSAIPRRAQHNQATQNTTETKKNNVKMPVGAALLVVLFNPYMLTLLGQTCLSTMYASQPLAFFTSTLFLMSAISVTSVDLTRRTSLYLCFSLIGWLIIAGLMGGLGWNDAVSVSSSIALGEYASAHMRTSRTMQGGLMVLAFLLQHDWRLFAFIMVAWTCVRASKFIDFRIV